MLHEAAASAPVQAERPLWHLMLPRSATAVASRSNIRAAIPQTTSRHLSFFF